jgi:hypothetical protein
MVILSETAPAPLASRCIQSALLMNLELAESGTLQQHLWRTLRHSVERGARSTAMTHHTAIAVLAANGRWGEPQVPSRGPYERNINV